MTADALLLAHAASTFFMAGLIWVIQLVHYPLMDRVARDGFPTFERAHQNRIAFLVGPGMLVEAATAVALVPFAPPEVSPFLVWLGAALIAVHVASTALWQMPCHRRLERGFDPVTHRRLVRTNWLRTAVWSARGLLVLAMLGQRMSAAS